MIEDLPSDDDILDDLFNLTTDIIPSVSDDDMRDFLSFVGKQHVRMEPQANEMLRDYFEATRMIRPSMSKVKFLSNEIFLTDTVSFQML